MPRSWAGIPSKVAVLSAHAGVPADPAGDGNDSLPSKVAGGASHYAVQPEKKSEESDHT